MIAVGSLTLVAACGGGGDDSDDASTPTTESDGGATTTTAGDDEGGGDASASAAEDAPRARRQEVRDLLYATEGEITAEGEAVVERGYVRSMVAEGTVAPDDPSIPDVRLRWDATFDDIGDELTVEPPDDDVLVDLADVPEVQEAFFDEG